MMDSIAGQEWRAAWPLPFVAMLGMSGSAIFSYASGVLLEPITHEFGWSRAAFSTTLMVQMLFMLVMAPIVGQMVDRLGARRIALLGIFPCAFGFWLLGLASGSIWQWWGVALVQSLFAAFIGPTVWVAAVVGRFHASRGLALAISLAGIGLASAIWPVIAAFYLMHLGWRVTFPAIGFSWALLVFPLAFFLFHDARTRVPVAPVADTVRPGALRVALLSRSFFCLAAAGALFASMSLGLTLHFVPILRDKGVNPVLAAGIAGMAGIFSVVGRVTTGFLLDYVRTRPLAVTVFLLPSIVAFLLWMDVGGAPLLVATAVILGLAQGAEIDILTYLTARQFGHDIFGSVYSVILSLVAVGASTGPLLAGMLYDSTGDYARFLLVVPMAVLVAAFLMAVMPQADGRQG